MSRRAELVTVSDVFVARAVPRWVRVLDALAVVLVCLTGLLLIGDGVRFEIGRVRIAVSSAARMAVWAAVAIGVRHVLYRTPSLPARLWTWIRGDVMRSDFPFVVRLIAATRLPVLLLGLLAVAAIGIQNETIGHRRYDDAWMDLIARWDALRYADIARFGYEWDGNPQRQQTVVFFPAFPLASHVVSRFLDIDALAAGWLVSIAAFAWAMMLFLRLARLSVDSAAAADSAWFLTAYPFAVFYSVPYTESLFLLAMCGMFLAGRQDRLRDAVLWGMLAGLTRPNGWLLAVPLGLLLFHERPRPSHLRDWLRRAVVVIAPLFGAMLFTLYLQWRFADGLAWIKGQAAWNRTFRGLHLFLADRFLYIRDLGVTQYLVDLPLDALNTAGALFALALVLPIAKRLGLAYSSLVVVLALPPLVMGGSTSMGRLTSVLFPLFIWLGAVLPRDRRTPIVILFATLQGLVAVLFFTWRDLY